MLEGCLIFFGAGLGGLSRYLLSQFIYRCFGQAFPYGTLFVNLTGALLMGILFTLLIDRIDGMGHALRAFLIIGLLGGYTTFSSFSIETLNLIENGAFMAAALNILINTFGCIVLTWIGVIGARL